MFKGKISVKVNRYGQESTKHVRAVAFDDLALVANSRVGGNAVEEIASEDRPTVLRVLTVPPNYFK